MNYTCHIYYEVRYLKVNATLNSYIVLYLVSKGYDLIKKYSSPQMTEIYEHRFYLMRSSVSDQ